MLGFTRASLLVVVMGTGFMGCTSTPETPEDTGVDPVPVDAAIERVAAEMEVLVAERMIPGISVAIVKEDGTLWSGSVGVADYDAGVEMTPETALKAGSTTKTVTMGRVLQLVESGVLNLEDAVSDHVGAIPAEHGIKIKHLLSHSSGLEKYGAYIEPGLVTASWEEEELIALISELPLRFEPGEEYYYANTNFVLLGMVVESVTGESWTDELNALLTSQEISTAWIPQGEWGSTSPGYYVYPNGELHSVEGSTHNAVNDFHPSIIGAAGNMVSDVVGLVKWGDALWGGERVVSNDTRTLMVTPVVEGSFYALGTIVLADEYGDQWSHNGAVNGYESHVGHRPADGVTLAVMGNAWLSYENKCCGPGWNWDVQARLWEAFYAEE